MGLIRGDTEWLVMLPIILSSNLLGMLALEFAWKYAALIVSPLLVVIPLGFVSVMSDRQLFQVDLPWGAGAGQWVFLHGLLAVAGVLVAVMLDRRRAGRASD